MDKKILDLINEQMNFEFESAYIYKAMAAYTDDLDLEGFTTWMDQQVTEEINHGEGMKNFLQSVGYKPVYKAIPEPKAEYDSVLDVMKSALEHEKEVTRRIRELFDAAHEIKFYEVYTLLQKFIDEQIEEEATFDNIIAKLERTENSNAGLAILDHEMAQRQ